MFSSLVVAVLITPLSICVENDELEENFNVPWIYTSFFPVTLISIRCFSVKGANSSFKAVRWKSEGAEILLRLIS